MKLLAPLIFLIALATFATADTKNPAAIDELLAGTVELGRINGLALACGQTDLVAKARALMLLRVPKTRRFGEAYEEASNISFRDLTGGGGRCPEAVILALRLEAIDILFQDAAKRAGVP